MHNCTTSLLTPSYQHGRLLPKVNDRIRLTVHRTAVQLDNIRIKLSVSFCIFFFPDRSCLRFICTNSPGGHQPHADSSPGVTPVLLSSHWQIRPLLWSLWAGLGTFGSLNLSWSWSCSCTSGCGLALGLSLGLGLWPAEPETLGNAGTSTFPELGVSSVGKSTELAAAACWDLGLDLLGL